MRYEVYGFPFILMCLGPMMTIGRPDIVLDVRKWLAGGMEKGDLVLLFPGFCVASLFIMAMMWLVLNARYRRILQQLRRSIAGGVPRPG